MSALYGFIWLRISLLLGSAAWIRWSAIIVNICSEKFLCLQLCLCFNVFPCYSGRHKQKPWVTCSKSVTSFSEHEMSSDTHCDKPKQIIPQIQVCYIMKYWCKFIISEENMNNGSNFQEYWKKKWIRTKQDLLPPAENVVRNLFCAEFLI